MSETQPNNEPNRLAEHADSEKPGDVRRMTVDAVARQKQLECRRRAAAELADKLEELAIHALDQDRGRVRILLDQRVEALKQEECLAEELSVVAARANRLKADLLERGHTAS